VAVARSTQPYRVAGRKVPPAASILDEAFTAIVASVRSRVGAAVPLVVGGRSSGARVACRTGGTLGAAGILALAFPLHPPGRPEKSRADELDPNVATLVVNGDADPFGVPSPVGRVRVEVRPGARHDLARGLPETAALVVEWLRDLPGIASLKRTNPAYTASNSTPRSLLDSGTGGAASVERTGRPAGPPTQSTQPLCRITRTRTHTRTRNAPRRPRRVVVVGAFSAFGMLPTRPGVAHEVSPAAQAGTRGGA
jgi:uncharacterized protein